MACDQSAVSGCGIAAARARRLWKRAVRGCRRSSGKADAAPGRELRVSAAGRWRRCRDPRHRGGSGEASRDRGARPDLRRPRPSGRGGGRGRAGVPGTGPGARRALDGFDPVDDLLLADRRAARAHPARAQSLRHGQHLVRGAERAHGRAACPPGRRAACRDIGWRRHLRPLEMVHARQEPGPGAGGEMGAALMRCPDLLLDRPRPAHARPLWL
jgi:hypothetical protein